jgi:hypothetical protein
MPFVVVVVVVVVSRGKWEDNVKWILKKYGMKLWTGFIWLITGNSDELLCTWQ